MISQFIQRPPTKKAILTLGVKQNKTSVSLKLQEIRYLTYIFPIVQNQLVKYTEAMGDVMKCYLRNKLNYICCATTFSKQKYTVL